jgi:TolA-binding protein
MLCGTLVLAAAPVWAQSRTEQQILLELRALQEQMQRLQLVINTVGAQVKATEGRIDAQANDTRKGFADQKGLIDGMAGGLRTLTEREGESSIRVAQLAQEMKAIRDGLAMQQTMLNEITTLLQPLTVGAATTPAGDPAAAGGAAPPSQVKPGAAIPPSPAAYYNSAFGYYYSNQFDLAVEALQEALTRFPESPEAARAQMTIGDAYFQMGKRQQDALTAYSAVIAKYKDPDVVPDAYYKQGLTYEQLGQKESARKSYEQVRTLYAESSAATLATQALKRLGFIK